ncbi:MAG: dihydropteroate synthase [Actinomycetota bacterium]
MWRCRERELRVFERVHVMGILNVTPDSFSDGGLFLDPSVAIKQGLEMVALGADIIDVGGESTRPGASPVAPDEEIRRVVPVIKALALTSDVAISVDTTKSSVAQAAIEVGASIVNDVSAMRSDPNMVKVVSDSKVGVVLMHMQGEPGTMQFDPQYEDVVEDVQDALMSAVNEALQAGISPDAIAIDPGIGFGKTARHNLQILNGFRVFAEQGYPVVVGPSRKAFIGSTLDV